MESDKHNLSVFLVTLQKKGEYFSFFGGRRGKGKERRRVGGRGGSGMREFSLSHRLQKTEIHRENLIEMTTS